MHVLTLDSKVVGISKVLLGQAWPLLGDLAHLLGTISWQNLQGKISMDMYMYSVDGWQETVMWSNKRVQWSFMWQVGRISLHIKNAHKQGIWAFLQKLPLPWWHILHTCVGASDPTLIVYTTNVGIYNAELTTFMTLRMRYCIYYIHAGNCVTSSPCSPPRVRAIIASGDLWTPA